MSFLVAPIEIAPVVDVALDDALLTVTLADGRVVSTPLDWYPRLARGTAQERANWRPIAGGEGIHWPDLDEDISVEGLIAGRKSGECAASLKRWEAIQAQVRQGPSEYRELRREVLRTGAMSGDLIARHAVSTVEAYGAEQAAWSIAVTSDPFGLLARHGIGESGECAVFLAESLQAAGEAVKDCVVGGMVELPPEISGPALPVYVALFASAQKQRRPQ